MGAITSTPHGLLVNDESTVLFQAPRNLEYAKRIQILSTFSGFHRNREFIITQHPMENTIMEFWQMMWDYNAQTVVMLTECDEVDKSFVRFHDIFTIDK